MKIKKSQALLVEKIWGGFLFSHTKENAQNHKNKIGESWEISTLTEGQSTIDGQALSEYLGKPLSYLVKLLETTEALSVQVHPCDSADKKGKTECWYILNAKRGAGIYLGFRPDVDANMLRIMLDSKQDISQLLNFFPVKAGDFFYTPAGSIHAIGKDIVLLEVQQSCGITYRVWDWNRLDDHGKPRDLQVEAAFESLNFTPECNRADYFNIKNLMNTFGVATLVEHQDFIFKIIRLRGHEKVHMQYTGKRPVATTILSGHAMINQQEFSQFESSICTQASPELQESRQIEICAKKDGVVLAWIE